MANPSKSSFKLKVLYGESDEDVLATQAVSIQKAGHEVASALGRKGVEDALRRQSFEADRFRLQALTSGIHPEQE